MAVTPAVATPLACGLGVCGCESCRSQILTSILLAVADPHLDTEGTNLGVCYCQSVVNVGAEGVQRGTTLFEHLAAGHFGAAHATCDLDLDALSTNAHGVGDGHLDSAAVADTAFDLTGDGVRHDVGVNLGALYLVDVDLNIFAGDFLELFLEFVNFLSALADDETGTCGIDGDGDELQCTLDDNLAEAGLRKAVAEILADLVVFSYLLCIVATTPVGVPTTGDTDSVADRVCFLSHITYSPLVVLHRG